MNIKHSKFQEGLMSFVESLTPEQIQAMTTANWIKLYKKIEKADLNIHNNFHIFEKLYENYRIPNEDSKNIKIIAQEAAAFFVQDNKNLHNDLISFNALPEKKRITLLNKIKHALYKTAFNTLNNPELVLEPTIEYIPSNYFSGLGTYDETKHRISVVRAKTKEHIQTLAHEVGHSFEIDVEKSLEKGKINSFYNQQTQNLLEYNSGYYIKSSDIKGVVHHQAYRQQPMEARARLYEIAFLREMFRQIGPKKANFDTCYNSLHTIIKHSDLKSLDIKIGLQDKKLALFIPAKKTLTKNISLVDEMQPLLNFEKKLHNENGLVLLLPEVSKELKEKMQQAKKTFLISDYFSNRPTKVAVRSGNPAKIYWQQFLR